MMILLEWAFDLLLVLALIGVAWAVLAVADLFKAVVLFIVFGLFLSLAWVRLAAPDVALAEAAIGAGLIGVLLLDALRYIQQVTQPAKPETHHDAAKHPRQS